MDNLIAHILVVDDDDGIRNLVKKYLNENNYLVTTALSAEDALEKINLIKFDLIILDIMMPGKSGLEFIKENQKKLETPIILLTAKGEPSERIEGLEVGADDYLPKPFEPRELVARIHNILRRSSDDNSVREIKPINGLEVDMSRREVKLDGDVLDLTTMEYELLVLFMQFPNKTFTRDELMNRLRGIDAELFSRAVDTLVSRLRHKLKDTSKTPRFIKTVWGRGYTFVGEQI